MITKYINNHNIANTQLKILRNKIDVLDNKLLNVLVQRFNIIKQVGEIKKKYGLPIYYPEREASLIHKKKKRAQNLQLSQNFIKKILQNIIYESYLYENIIGFKKLNINCKTILIIGKELYTGHILKNILKSASYNIKMLDEYFWKKNNFYDYFIDIEMIILNISITSLNLILKHLPKLSKTCIIVDLSPVKTFSIEKITKKHYGPVLGLYPILHTNVTILTKQYLIYTHGRFSKIYSWFLEQIKLSGCQLIKVQYHDIDMYIVQLQSIKYFNVISINNLILKYKKYNFSQNILKLTYVTEFSFFKKIFLRDRKISNDLIKYSANHTNIFQKYIKNCHSLLLQLTTKNKKHIPNVFRKIQQYIIKVYKIFHK
ncbi:hypothetical protein GJT87_01955 [Enterobacteriaceae endosymbiont of Macroplea mutica]|uniref:chorismate mutase n=1 Tax=Enterobacteriaceae endosymbiont of Macroplea mutica TaxID=2675791 RepID=UPI001448CBD0|nr:chorismate mutase [Enterobacteriaceae endosymbiont of Macroplea mutica]QJC31389.1 hypothetical protein GJT87_01955 [Enterobacteriaceae endosymbiont of Macroplea mutica]